MVSGCITITVHELIAWTNLFSVVRKTCIRSSLVRYLYPGGVYSRIWKQPLEEGLAALMAFS